MQNVDKTTVIVRFIGTSDLSSSIIDIFESIIFQLKHLFKLNIQEYDKKKLNSIRSTLEACLEEIYQQDSQHNIIIILDSIDQLTKLDYGLDWLLNKIPCSVKIIYSTITDYANLLETLKLKYSSAAQNNFLEIKSFNFDDAKFIIDNWLCSSHVMHKLTDEQSKLLDQLLNNSKTLYPLYLKIIHDIVFKWTSFYTPDERFLRLRSIDSSIKYIFQNLENLHGKIVFSRCMFYFSIFNDGISENEIEDILSIDDDVLSDVFQHHEPTIRRFPGALWQRIKNDLKDYIFESKADDIRVLHWYNE